MKIKRIVLSVLLVLWMMLIFALSNQPAAISEGTSDSVASHVIDIYKNVANKKITKEKKNSIIEDTRFLVRKTAHFTAYFILNLICYFTLKAYGVKHCIIFSILISFLFACSDEIHQLFVFERAGRVLDVFIDTSGAVLSSLIIIEFKHIFVLKNKKLN